MKQRLQKILAEAGIASRREAERLISQGRVSVNGQVVTRLGALASPHEDLIEVDGAPIPRREALSYYILNKPRGVVTTARDTHGRPTVVDLLRDVGQRLYPVGRLDAASEGLLLLTNDGPLAYRLTHPRFGVEKEYEVELSSPASDRDLDRIRRGVESRGERLTPLQVRARDASGLRMTIVLAEGKKREVRRMFEAVGRQVTRLKRVRFGPLQLGRLPSGSFRQLSAEEVERLRAAASA